MPRKSILRSLERQLSEPLVPASIPAPKRSYVREDPTKLTIPEQTKRAFLWKNLGSTLGGFLLGGIVPVSVFWVGHYEIHLTDMFTMEWSAKKIMLAMMVAGGLVFSAKTVAQWASRAFLDVWKAVGFVVLVEGLMTVCETAWLSFVLLGFLFVINGIATGTNLSLKSIPEKKEKE